MMSDLDGVRAKLMRAGEHIGTLARTIQPIAGRVQRSIRRERTASTVTYRVMEVGQLASSYFSVMVGDVIHNLRSALDHLAWQLVILDGGRPNRRTKFPIYKSPTDVTIEPGISDPRIIDALIEVQPFTHARYGHDPVEEPFWIIRELNNLDKHRLLVTIAHTIDHGRPPGYGGDEGDPKPRWTINQCPLHDGDVVMTFDFGDAPVPPSFDAEVAVAMSIYEPAAKWLNGLNIVDGLDGLLRNVVRDVNIHFLPLWNGPSMEPLYVP